MPSKLNQYDLLKTLGSGGYSKVKLAQDTNTKEFYAIKIIKKVNKKQDMKNLDMVINEVSMLSKLKHPHILNVIDCGESGFIIKPDSKEEEVIYAVLELAKNGELFEYISITGKFQEKVARYFFQQLIEGLQYLHSKELCHRDLKPENLLLDKDFNLKIADFGFAANSLGKDGYGFRFTKLGTDGYMAPELHQELPYKGEAVDIFACGVILFILIAQHKPFGNAAPHDPFYNLISKQKFDAYWKIHTKNKAKDFFSEDFKDLLLSLIRADPGQRITIEEIKAHKWYNGPIPSKEEILEEFKDRQALIDESKKNRMIKQANEVKTKKGAYRGFDFSDEQDEGDEESKSEQNARKLDDYIEIPFVKTPQFFLTNDPDEILTNLTFNFDNLGYSYQLSPNKYKITVQIKEEEQELPLVEFSIKISRVEEELFCVDFMKTEGDSMLFYETYRTLKGLIFEEETEGQEEEDDAE